MVPLVVVIFALIGFFDEDYESIKLRGKAHHNNVKS